MQLAICFVAVLSNTKIQMLYVELMRNGRRWLRKVWQKFASRHRRLPSRSTSAERGRHKGKGRRKKAKSKTYGKWDSQVVTNPSTNHSVSCLCMAERTGCPVIHDLVAVCDWNCGLIQYIADQNHFRWTPHCGYQGYMGGEAECQ